jgi:2-alkyl-3-oxoalkanoate reductase
MKVGIIGCGRIARTHMATLHALPDVEVVGLCDSYLPAAGALAERFGVNRAYRTVDELLEDGCPQAVHILTPPHTHADLALRALETGAHVLVEKPLATSSVDAAAMVTAAKRKGLTLCVDHNRLFDPVVEKARRLVEHGTIGEVVSVETYHGFNRGAEAANSEHWSLRSPTGIYYNLAVHGVYLQLAFLGQVQDLAVFSKNTGRFPAAFAEEVRVLLQGKHALGHLCFSLDIQPHLNHVCIYGTRGTLVMNLNTMTLIKRLPSRLPKLLAKSWENVGEATQLLTSTVVNGFAMLSGRLSLYPGIATVIRRFYESVLHGAPPPISAEEGYEVVRLLEEIHAQALRPMVQNAEPSAKREVA